MNMKTSVLLLSGGLDSVAQLYLPESKKHQFKLAITVNYGQKAFTNELIVAKYHCKKLNIPHKLIKIPFLASLSKSSLTDLHKKIPQGKDIQIDNKKVSTQSAKSVWVPNRNGLMLNIAAVYAEALNTKFVIMGFNKEEAVTFSDNSTQFMNSANHFFSFSTQNKVKTYSASHNMDKSQMVKILKNQSDLSFWSLWPCYQNQATWCGQCESCQRFKRALESSKISWKGERDKNKAFIKYLRSL